MTHPYDPPIQSLTAYLYNHTITNPTVYASARTALLDALGCAIETASKSTEAQKLLGPRVPGTIVPNGFRVPGTGYQLDPVKGAFDLGVLIRGMCWFLVGDDDDGGNDGSRTDNLASILSVTDWLCRTNEPTHNGPPMTIHTLLTALIKAYEIQGIYAQSNAFNTHGTDHVILVKLASAAVVSWLLGLTESQTMATISHVWMDGHPSRVYRGAENTIPRKGWAAGDASMRAVHLALLVRAGQVGVPSVLSAVPWGFYQRDFGGEGFEFIQGFGDWAVRNVLYKVMPVEGHGIAAVEAVLVQRGRLLEMGFGVRDVERIEIRTTRAADLIINKRGPLGNPAERDHCMQFVVALALLKGGVPEVGDYQDESCWVKSQALESLRERVVVVPDDRLTADYLDLEKKSIGSGLKVCLCDGTVLPEVLVEYPIGHVRNPKTSAAVRDKFVRNMRLVFSDAHIAKVLAAVEDDEMSISEFVNLFWLQGSSRPRL
ncbi:prpD [Aspergillus parasiticus SU-1]|uniref:PrpD n=1 Tax=Aspergillus parasiticus (strain ATCC 56775 / NRRL 5862 / SRRC 143 / SU-1) TaxID=1403190 RepID=A0A0F0I3R6_ASPPU|nr:prpD [Aspergillus parasiticus SU-1]